MNTALRDEEIRGLFCLRGGYGVQRIVDGIDNFEAVKSNPKLVMGFSDITALHAALWREAGLVTVHRPTAIQLGADAVSAHQARRALMTTAPVMVGADESEGTFRLRVAGTAQGVLLGGNLTMLAYICWDIGRWSAPPRTGNDQCSFGDIVFKRPQEPSFLVAQRLTSWIMVQKDLSLLDAPEADVRE